MFEPGGVLRGSALDLAPMLSYAGNQEDVRLRRIAGLLPSQVYVDVGAGDPVDGSVTYWLYTQGWRGVLVEPGSRRESLADARPEDVVVAAAVAEGAGELVLYETSPDPGMSTMRADRLADVLALGQTVHEVKVPLLTLTEVFAQAPGPVSVLSVDVEGAEGAVLRSLDWTLHRPVVVVVEAILPWSTTSTVEDFEPLLTAAGYVRAAFDGVNTWYVDASAPNADELGATLAYPVSLLDRWETSTAASWRERAAQADGLNAEIAGLASRIEQLEARLAAAGRDAEHTDREVVTLRRERDELVGRVAALQDRVERAEQALADVEAEAAHLQHQRDAVNDQLAAVLGSTTWRYGAPVAHALRRRLGVVSGVRGPKRAVVLARAELIDRIGEARARRLGPAGRAALAVRRHTHPAFLEPSAPVGCSADTGDWSARALTGLDDDDEALRRRLEARTGVRDLEQRAIQVAALAEVVHESGKVHRPRGAVRDLCVFDARCLQDPGLATRGVGRYASEVLAALAEQGQELLLLLDPALPAPSSDLDLDLDLATATSISSTTAARTRWLVQPSPMTVEAWPLTALLSDGDVWSTTVLYDFIPSRFPSCYLPDSGSALRHAARQRSLGLYDEVWSISASTVKEFLEMVPGQPQTTIVWPVHERVEGVTDRGIAALGLPRRYVLVAAGNEHRKNVIAGLAAIALHRQVDPAVGAVVLGWSGSADVLGAWADECGLPPDALHILPYIDAAAAAAVRSNALAAIVPSYAEGLSLPVIECPSDGCPVVVSDIPAHVELVGRGAWTAAPSDPSALARALGHVLKQREHVLADQQRVLAAHVHETVPEVVARRSGLLAARPTPRKDTPRSGARPSLGLVTPWPPQRSGIADYSAATLGSLGDVADVTLYASRSAGPAPGFRMAPGLAAAPGIAAHDRLVTVIGNSHFHLPGLEFVQNHGGVALCHDVRMTELNSYLGLEESPRAGRQTAALEGAGRRRTLRHDLDALPNLGFEHLAHTCELLLFHSEAAARRVAAETGAATASLPFVPYRLPSAQERAPGARARARAARGLGDSDVHLGLFGGVDVRTKAADVLIEAVAWLRQWGVPVVLHVVGGVEGQEKAVLSALARDCGIVPHVRWHGHVEEAGYRGWLSAVDLGVQLRSAALLSLSGAVVDLAAYAVPSVATAAMVADMGLPAFVRPVADDFSPLLVAEALVDARRVMLEDADVLAQRDEYLATHSTAVYQERLLAAVGLDIG